MTRAPKPPVLRPCLLAHAGGSDGCSVPYAQSSDSHRLGLGDQIVGIGGVDLLAALRLDMVDEGAQLAAGAVELVGVEVSLRIGELLEQAVLEPARRIERFDESITSAIVNTVAVTVTSPLPPRTPVSNTVPAGPWPEPPPPPPPMRPPPPPNQPPPPPPAWSPAAFPPTPNVPGSAGERGAAAGALRPAPTGGRSRAKARSPGRAELSSTATSGRGAERGQAGDVPAPPPPPATSTRSSKSMPSMRMSDAPPPPPPGLPTPPPVPVPPLLKPPVGRAPWPPTFTWIESPEATGIVAVARPPRPARKRVPQG